MAILGTLRELEGQLVVVADMVAMVSSEHFDPDKFASLTVVVKEQLTNGPAVVQAFVKKCWACLLRVYLDAENYSGFPNR